jgi:acetyltransferase
VQLGLPPLNLALARRIIERTRVYSLLRGFRELEGVDLRQLETLLVRFAYLLMDFPDIEEIDINPLIMDAGGGVVVDAAVAIAPEPTQHSRPYPHLVISPYPERYQRSVCLRDGTEVLLRPIRPEDEPLVETLLGRQSRETLYFRFFGQAPKVNHQFLTRFTQIDYDREMAIVATQPLAGSSAAEEEILGVVRIIADPWREGGEYAILVSDHFQGKGLGRILTDYILEIARDMGLLHIHASVLATNQPMIGLFRKAGFTLEREDFETYHVHKKLT